jgi:tetratricopeptide (TPR) repeat protein
LSRIERYLKIQEEYPSHWAANHVPFRLANAYHTIGDPRSEELYLNALHNERASSRVEAALRLVQIYERQDRLEEALAIIHFCQEHLAGHSPIEVQITLGDILAARGDKAKAREAYEAALFLARGIQEDFDRDSVEAETHRQLSVVSQYEELIGLKATGLDDQQAELVPVRGMVTLLGEPLAGVNVYVRLVVDGQQQFYTRTDRPGLWVTDEGGRFTGTLAPGTYEFGIGMDYYQAQLVEGTHLQILQGTQELQPGIEPVLVEFRFVESIELTAPAPDLDYAGEPLRIEWEPYAGAKEYEIAVSGVSYDQRGGSSFVIHPVEVTGGTSFVFAGRNLNPFGLVSVDPEGVTPASFLSRPASFDALRIRVHALDEGGNVLSSSGGLHFGGESLIPGGIPVQKGLETQAEKLILARAYDEAVELLEQQIKEDPADIDALWILARIYFAGTSAQGEDTWDRNHFAHRDLGKSLKVLQQIEILEPSLEVEDALRVVQHGLASEHE